MFPSFDKLIDSEFAQNSRLLSAFRFLDSEAATTNLMRLRAASAEYEQSREDSHTHSVPPWYKTLKRILLEAPVPATVLDVVAQFVQKNRPPHDAFELFEETPRSLEVLARLSSGSPFLTQCILIQPEVLRELTTERRTSEIKSRDTFCGEAFAAVNRFPTTILKLTELRRYQRREILRIGMCDAFGLLDLKFVTLQISLLADAVIRVCLKIACDDAGIQESPLSVIALGKHGGEELNYSSDIDLILISRCASQMAQRIARRLIDGLSENLATGFLYRVDMRLRPWGDAGPLVSTPESYEKYLRSDADLWEKQALLKARLVAGDALAGEAFLKRLPPVLFAASSEDILRSVRRMKSQIEDRLRHGGKLDAEVKLGTGSIRDIEFLTQALQLIHGAREPRLASANTLDALVRLTEFGVINGTEYRRLREGYVFLRTIEHALQLLHNQQTHELPADPEQREWLARRLDFLSADQLLTRFDEHRRAVRRIFDLYFHAAAVSPRSQASNSAISAPQEHLSAGSVLDHWISEQQSSHRQLCAEILSEALDTAEVRIHCQMADADSRQIVMIVAGPEVRGLLSIICGVFIANDLDIREGVTVIGPGTNRFRQQVPPCAFLGIFLVEKAAGTGNITSANTGRLSCQIHAELAELLSLARSGDSRKVREQLLEMFCRRLDELRAPTAPQAEISVTVSAGTGDAGTRLDIDGDDSFGFFFELANALAICGFRIIQAELGGTKRRIRDVLHVTEADGSVVETKERIEELRTAITLIKQFTNRLPSINDPHQALLRFRDLLLHLLRDSRWESNAATLREPEVLRAVSRVLGMSRYLWEDFLQVHPDTLLPLLTEPERLQLMVSQDDLTRECVQLLADEADTRSIRQRLNSFKDHHLFRIDLRHVLGYCGQFGVFSREITDLAEVVIQAACRIALAELLQIHGLPRLTDGQECGFTLAALGKFGGVEMGFASDIEMFLVFRQECRTDGTVELSAGSFFERLMNRIPQLIESRRKGIFEIDLRMRPYGSAGSTAVSLATWQQYFGPAGDAWPYERQSLVKLRCIGGHPDFAETLNKATRKIVYSPQTFDFDAMRAMREKQIRQLVHGGTINAKLSGGGLVDCEYAVQALQLTYGSRIPALQTSNTIQALTVANAESLITEGEFAVVSQSYRFLRELIDCLRMVRGNAEDLTVPDRETADYAHLARRMKAVHDSPISLDDLELQMANVRAFSDRVEQICRKNEGFRNLDKVSRR